MGIFNTSGSTLSAAFSAAGFSVKRAYALDGTLLWKARSLTDILDSAGAHIPWNEWKFCQISNTADSSYTSTAEAAKNFDDSTWESVTIPHDWSIRNDFNSASPATYEGGFLDGGDAWYRTSFTVPEALKTERVVLYFDGVYMEAAVYLNGELLGRNYHATSRSGSMSPTSWQTERMYWLCLCATSSPAADGILAPASSAQSICWHWKAAASGSRSRM